MKFAYEVRYYLDGHRYVEEIFSQLSSAKYRASQLPAHYNAKVWRVKVTSVYPVDRNGRRLKK